MRGQDLSGLGFDPAPGDAESVRRVAAGLRVTGRRVGAVAADLSLPAGQLWSGAAARSFQACAHKLPPDATAAADSFLAAATALEEYADVLSGGASRAAALDAEARQAAERATQAKAAGNDPRPAEDALMRALRSARGLAGAVQDAAERAAAQVRRAAEHAPAEPGLLQRVAVAAVDTIGEVNDAVGDWVVQHAGAIALLSDTLATVSSACGLLAFVPVVGPVFGTVALATGVGATAGHVLLAAYTDAQWTTAAVDGLGLVTMGASRALTSRVAAESVATNGVRPNGQTWSIFSTTTVMGDREMGLRIGHYAVESTGLIVAGATAARPAPASSMRGTGPGGVDWRSLHQPSPGPVPPRPLPPSAPVLTERVGLTPAAPSVSR